MRSSRNALLLLLLLLASCLFVATPAFAEDAAVAEEDAAVVPEEEEDDASDSTGRRHLDTARVIFPDSPMVTVPTLPAGSKTAALIAYRNNQMGHTHTVILVAGYLTPLNVYEHVVQNFSIVRHARPVRPAETTSFQYSFTPDAQLEPNEYNLILGLYYSDDATNNTYFITAFNGTVTVEEALGTDPKTVLTYLTLLGLLGGGAYLLASKVGLVAVLKARRHGGSARRRVEIGTNGDGYDPDYVSEEHHRYKEAVLQRHASSSPSKKKKQV
ncbi:translocon-associated protein subunit alpha [Trypanosoma grayi]|uniref:translocon-associated protein subunit alpha n=1 Tax=Trypanosoma grayi TaxID=71804 RepID=UPI0004F4ADF0|nr:translocon-associated protein subunit alpha [Trypanosoma grayi]KEG07504.1 translocon-associated protein subunit alpha [Trypanosoma grayi]